MKHYYEDLQRKLIYKVMKENAASRDIDISNAVDA